MQLSRWKCSVVSVGFFVCVLERESVWAYFLCVFGVVVEAAAAYVCLGVFGVGLCFDVLACVVVVSRVLCGFLWLCCSVVVVWCCGFVLCYVSEQGLR